MSSKDSHLSNKDFLLVTTALEESWMFNSRTIFLGEWCLRKINENKWSKIDYLISEPYGLDSLQKEKDLNEVNNIYDKLLVDMVVSLNKYHKTNYSKRYWEIIIGYWLKRYIKVVINRYKTIFQALSKYNIKSTVCLNTDEFSLITHDYYNFSWSLEDDMWNHAVYCDILKNIESSDINFINRPNTIIKKNVRPKPTNLNYSGACKKVITGVFKFLQKFSRANDAFILNSYLPTIKELELQLLLGQVPQIWRGFEYKTKENNDVSRDFNFIDFTSYAGVEREVRRMLIKIMPTSYLEEYKSVNNYVSELPWPSNPKFIFTSNDFMANEVFKFWCASKTEQGCKYFIGQHGNNYGTLDETKGIPEYSTSDCFLSWGWKDKEINAVPLFNFKIAGKKKKTLNNKGGLLIVNRGPGKRDGPQDRFYENKKYQQSVSNFYLSLDKNIRKKTIVRMHQISQNTNSDDRIHWESSCKGVKIDNGLRPINKLIDDCKIVVFTYDSTGVLESLALNRPTICYWPSGIDHLLPEAIPYYKKLISVGIINNNPSELISNVWNDVDSWWYSNELQDAVNEFCNQYSRTVDKPIYTLKDKLVSIL